MAKILIIDDDDIICSLLQDTILKMGHDAACASTIRGGLEAALSGDYDVVLLDVNLPDGSGLSIVPEIRTKPSSPEVIIITGHGEKNGAELAMRSGAWDYIEKPASTGVMKLSLLRALQYRELKEAPKKLKVLNREKIIGKSKKMQTCIEKLAMAAACDANVLLSGETGTGKELFARAIHENSSRNKNAFVVVDCASLPISLAESALFGHEKGSFTGADRQVKGLIHEAAGGTLFLDEVGELPPHPQKIFLRTLQERRYRPVGSSREIESDFRLIAATNRNLDKMVEEKTYRKDLLFRLRTLSIELPPLREHPEDIGELVVHSICRLCKKYDMGLKGFSPEFLEMLLSYDWPGNIRELINTLETAHAAAFDEPMLFPKHLPLDLRIAVVKSLVKGDGQELGSYEKRDEWDGRFPRLQDVRDTAVAKIEAEYLKNLFCASKDKIKKACELSGLSRQRLYQLIKKHQLRHPPAD